MKPNGALWLIGVSVAGDGPSIDRHASRDRIPRQIHVTGRMRNTGGRTHRRSAGMVQSYRDSSVLDCDVPVHLKRGNVRLE